MVRRALPLDILGRDRLALIHSSPQPSAAANARDVLRASDVSLRLQHRVATRNFAVTLNITISNMG